MNQDNILQYYDNIARKYDDDRFNNSYGRFIDTQERRILNKLLLPGEIIVDLACGTGRFLNFAAIGIDGNKEMIGLAQRKFPQKTLYIADAKTTPLDDKSVDTIIIFHLFMHLNQEKIDRILLECSRILKENGRIIFDIPSKKRRQVLGFKSNGWHGSYSMAFADLKALPHFTVNKKFGILFLPIHRFPKFTRILFSKIDSLLSNSFLKEYSSYLIIEANKNDTNKAS